jgi:hypothetical protein
MGRTPHRNSNAITYMETQDASVISSPRGALIAISMTCSGLKQSRLNNTLFSRKRDLTQQLISFRGLHWFL